MKNEIILYQSDELPEHIEVRLDEVNETFWLSLKYLIFLKGINLLFPGT